MNPVLRVPNASDYDAISSWIPDAVSCARWAGPRLRFPFTPQELPELLEVSSAFSFSLAKVTALSRALGNSGAELRVRRISAALSFRRTSVAVDMAKPCANSLLLKP